MAGRNPQTMAKRARELAVKERRDRKRERKLAAAAERAAARAAGTDNPGGEDAPDAGDDAHPAVDEAHPGAEDTQPAPAASSDDVT